MPVEDLRLSDGVRMDLRLSDGVRMFGVCVRVMAGPSRIEQSFILRDAEEEDKVGETMLCLRFVERLISTLRRWLGEVRDRSLKDWLTSSGEKECETVEFLEIILEDENDLCLEFKAVLISDRSCTVEGMDS